MFTIQTAQLPATQQAQAAGPQEIDTSLLQHISGGLPRVGSEPEPTSASNDNDQLPRVG